MLSESNFRAQNMTMEVTRSNFAWLFILIWESKNNLHSSAFLLYFVLHISKYDNAFEYQGLSKIETQWDGMFGIYLWQSLAQILSHRGCFASTWCPRSELIPSSGILVLKLTPQGKKGFENLSSQTILQTFGSTSQEPYQEAVSHLSPDASNPVSDHLTYYISCCASHMKPMC